MRIAKSLFLLCVLAQATGCAPALDDAAQRRRCAECTPSWISYDEDLKAVVGATPVALWEGAPVAMALQKDILEVHFQVKGPWAALQAQIPMLLRTPEGAIIRNSATFGKVGTHRVYSFPLKGHLAGAIPWVELRYPRHERRFSLDKNHRWGAEIAQAS